MSRDRVLSTDRPSGLWPFTEMVLNRLDALGCPVLRIDAHDDEDGADFLWGELTPELELSAGEYMRIDQYAGRYSMMFGQRAHFGGDPTWGDGYSHLLPSTEHASLVATEFCRHFSNAKAGDDAHD
ncbi:hypothetical protein [Pseudomonas putida]|uniref:hypothetical protein n=1 Tax=Pseudomonas putida TaxID=303 RepID=UPI0012FD18CB|nr:hypothetical protein [Pseudomonas putida]